MFAFCPAPRISAEGKSCNTFQYLTQFLLLRDGQLSNYLLTRVSEQMHEMLLEFPSPGRLPGSSAHYFTPGLWQSPLNWVLCLFTFSTLAPAIAAPRQFAPCATFINGPLFKHSCSSSLTEIKVRNLEFSFQATMRHLPDYIVRTLTFPKPLLICLILPPPPCDRVLLWNPGWLQTHSNPPASAC